MELKAGDQYEVVVLDGQPCHHLGCLHHIFQPCEGCGRIGGRGNVTVRKTAPTLLTDNGKLSSSGLGTLNRRENQ